MCHVLTCVSWTVEGEHVLLADKSVYQLLMPMQEMRCVSGENVSMMQ